jgi:N-acetylmuramoyl-L-alanine amidase
MPKVFLSAGHGGNDPGAVANGLKEKVVNLNTLLACVETLERHGVEVECSRTTDVNDPVKEEVNESNDYNADISVSFHANAGGGDGFEAFYHSRNQDGKKLAELCEKHIKSLGQNSRGVKHGDHLYFIKYTTATSVLLESFFVDNEKDKTIGDTVAKQRLIGEAYGKAILDYFGIKHELKAPVYRVQVGAFSNRFNAEKEVRKLKKSGFDGFIVKG